VLSKIGQGFLNFPENVQLFQLENIYLDFSDFTATGLNTVKIVTFLELTNIFISNTSEIQKIFWNAHCTCIIYCFQLPGDRFFDFRIHKPLDIPLIYCFQNFNPNKTWVFVFDKFLQMIEVLISGKVLYFYQFFWFIFCLYTLRSGLGSSYFLGGIRILRLKRHVLEFPSGISLNF